MRLRRRTGSGRMAASDWVKVRAERCHGSRAGWQWHSGLVSRCARLVRFRRICHRRPPSLCCSGTWRSVRSPLSTRHCAMCRRGTRCRRSSAPGRRPLSTRPRTGRTTARCPPNLDRLRWPAPGYSRAVQLPSPCQPVQPAKPAPFTPTRRSPDTGGCDASLRLCAVSRGPARRCMCTGKLACIPHP